MLRLASLLRERAANVDVDAAVNDAAGGGVAGAGADAGGGGAGVTRIG